LETKTKVLYSGGGTGNLPIVMNFEHQIRSSARKYLPTALRKPLGGLSGLFRSHVLYPFLGLLFDLTGGRFKADGCVLIIPKNITSLEFRACFLLRTYEMDERRLVQKHITPDDSVLELGACLGVLSCITNKRLRNPARHVVVEANPYCLPAIHRNRNFNQAGFLVENCVISNDTRVNFFVNPAYVTGSSAKTNSGHAVVMPGRSLSELIGRYGPFSVLIMDIEGSELEVLESAAEILLNFRLILLELHDWVIGADGVKRCRELLARQGFQLVETSYITEVWVKPAV
jgi:FkbM family methyltransferase